METDLFKLKMQIANLELHNAIMEDALLDAIDFINKYSDVVGRRLLLYLEQEGNQLYRTDYHGFLNMIFNLLNEGV